MNTNSSPHHLTQVSCAITWPRFHVPSPDPGFMCHHLTQISCAITWPTSIFKRTYIYFHLLAPWTQLQMMIPFLKLIRFKCLNFKKMFVITNIWTHNYKIINNNINNQILNNNNHHQITSNEFTETSTTLSNNSLKVSLTRNMKLLSD